MARSFIQWIGIWIIFQILTAPGLVFFKMRYRLSEKHCILPPHLLWCILFRPCPIRISALKSQIHIIRKVAMHTPSYYRGTLCSFLKYQLALVKHVSTIPKVVLATSLDQILHYDRSYTCTRKCVPIPVTSTLGKSLTKVSPHCFMCQSHTITNINVHCYVSFRCLKGPQTNYFNYNTFYTNCFAQKRVSGFQSIKWLHSHPLCWGTR